MKIDLPDEMVMEMLDRCEEELNRDDHEDDELEWMGGLSASTIERLSDDQAEELFRNCPKYSECDSRKELGRMGEKAARTYLARIGYELVEANWSCRFGEADIIARDEEDLVFIEVKTRSGINTGFPEEAVTAEKRRRYENIARCYLAQGDFEGSFPVRFDVIGILILGPHRAFLRHHRNAFCVCDQQ